MIINIKENLDYLIEWYDIYHISYHGDWTRNDNGRIFLIDYNEDDPYELMVRLYCEMYMKEKKTYYKGIYYKLIDNTSVYFEWR